MGLTLNSSSLTLEAAGGSGGAAAAAASGLSEADVNTLIKAKTDWTLIASLDASGSNSVDFDNVFDGSYPAYKIEGANLQGNHWVYARLKSSQGVETSTYGHSMNWGNSSSGTYWGSSSSYIYLMYDSTQDHAKSFELIVTGLDSGKKATGRYHSGHGTSTYDGGYAVGGFVLGNTRENTGIQIRTNTGTFTEGHIKVYGLN